MTREQAVIKLPASTEIPVISLDAPLLWVAVILAFVVAMAWVRKK